MMLKRHIFAFLVLLFVCSSFVKSDDFFGFGTINPWREFQTAANTQIVCDEGHSIFTRLYFKKSRVSETGIAALEFPVYQNVVAGLSNLTAKGFQPFCGKLANIIIGLIAYFFYFLLIRRLTGKDRIAFLALFFMMFCAIIVMYERALMSDFMALCFSIMGIYFFLLNIQSNRNGQLVLGILFSTLALLIKPPFGVVIFLPYLITILLSKKASQWKLIGAGIIIPGVITVAWLMLETYVNEKNGFLVTGIKQNVDWFIGSFGLRFTSYWMTIVRNICFNVATPIGSIFFVAGLFYIIRNFRENKVLVVWFLSGFIYVTVFFRIQSHIYYILPLVPVIAVLMAIGLDWLIVKTERIYKYKNMPIVSVVIVLLFVSYFLFHNLPRGYANANFSPNLLSGNKSLPANNKRYLPKLGNYTQYAYRATIDRITQKDDLILQVWCNDWTPTNGFLTRRYGENIGFDKLTKVDIDKYIEKGFKYAFVYNRLHPNEKLYLNRFSLAFNDPNKFRVYNLTKCRMEYQNLVRPFAEGIEEAKERVRKYFAASDDLTMEKMFWADEVLVGGKTVKLLRNPNHYVEKTCFLPMIETGFYILRFEYKNSPDAFPVVVITPWTGEFHIKFNRHIPLISACSDEYYEYKEIFYVPKGIKILHPRLIFRNHNQGEIRFKNIGLSKINNALIGDMAVNKEDYVVVF